MEKKKGFSVTQPLSMRLLVIVSLLTLTINSALLTFVLLREQRNVTVTVINGRD